jgi:hypothetical protein
MDSLSVCNARPKGGGIIIIGGHSYQLVLGQ